MLFAWLDSLLFMPGCKGICLGPITDIIHYHVQLELPDKNRKIKELTSYNNV